MFSATLVGDRELIARLDAMPDGVRDELKKKISQLAIQLQAHVVRDKLSGQVLRVRTGALRRSIQQMVEDEGTAIYGRIYSTGDVKYAAAHEFGFSGQETVRAHTRDTVFGRKVEPFTVASFTRNMNIPARSFMRSSLDDMAEQLRSGMRQAVVDGMRKALGQ